jgi:hypothetical protein
MTVDAVTGTGTAIGCFVPTLPLSACDLLWLVRGSRGGWGGAEKGEARCYPQRHGGQE